MTTKLERHAAQLAALGHPMRLAMLRYVVRAGIEGAAAGDIQSEVDMPASTASYHLRQLVEAGLVTARDEGTFRYYAAEYTALKTLSDYLWEDCCKRGTAPSSGCC